LDFYSASSLKQQSADRHQGSPNQAKWAKFSPYIS